MADIDRADLRAALTNALAILDQRGGYGWTDAANILRDALATPDRAETNEGAEEHCCNDPEHMSPEYLAALRDHSGDTPDRADHKPVFGDADWYPPAPDRAEPRDPDFNRWLARSLLVERFGEDTVRNMEALFGG